MSRDESERRQKTDDAIEHAQSLSAARRPVSTSSTTERFDDPDFTVEAEVKGAPTFVSRTDSESGKEPHASQIRSAVRLLASAVANLRDEVRSVGSSVRSLEDRHDRLRDIVQSHNSRLEELDAAILDLVYLRYTVRALLVLGGCAAALQLLTLGAVAALVVQ